MGHQKDTKMNTVDNKRKIGRDGWAMLVALGDVVEGEVVDRSALIELDGMISPPTMAQQDLEDGPRARMSFLGCVVDAELRAEGTELWVEFDENVTAHRHRRAALGRAYGDRAGTVSICTPEVRSLRGDREQRGYPL